MTSPSSWVVMDPPPSLSKMANASLNSFTCRRVRYGLQHADMRGE